MKTLKFFIILLLPIIVSSTKCEIGEHCFVLCCGITQMYDPKTNYCKELSKEANITLERWIYNREVEEYGECEKSITSGSLFSSTIRSCYSPTNKDYKTYFMVPCKRNNLTSIHATESLDKFKFYVFECLTTMLLLIILVYSFTRKGKRNNISFKLVTWYMTSTVATTVSTMVQSIISSPYLIILHDIFAISTFLWLSSIGYEIYKGFTTSNNDTDSGQVRRRFICYSLYVWGSSIIIIFFVRLAFDIYRRRWHFLILNRLEYVIALLNFVIFLVLSLKICIIRCSVSSMTTEDNFVCNILRILLRLCIMMGIPRMLCITLEPLLFFSSRLIPIVFFLEPYLVFLTFVAEGEYLTSLCSKCRCFQRTDKVQENENTNETSLKQSTTV